MLGHPVDGAEQEVEDVLGDEVVEVDPHPAGLDALVALEDLALELARGVEVDAQQPVTVRPGARTAAAGLDAEEVVQERDDEVVVQIAVAVAHQEGDDR